MTVSPSLPPQAAEGFELLQRGNPGAALPLLQAAAAEAPQEVNLQLGVAMALRDLGQHELCNDELDGVLAQHPRHFMALVMKADTLMHLGRRREAASWYNAVVSAAPPEAQQPPNVRAHVERARRTGQQLVADYETHLRSALSAGGFDAAPGRPGRVSEALDILFGRRRIYAQEPEHFYFPGLPQRQFYERAEFPWTGDIEACTDAIAEEARGVLELDDGFRPYLHAGETRGPRVRDSSLYGKVDWSAAYLVRGGEVNERIAARCPATMAAIEAVPLCRVDGKSPNVLFSLLEPGTRIEPHNGLVNYRLICHLPLIVPGGCNLRVGNETRAWRRGELSIFDDSVEHEAENASDELRIVLLFDVWRPELSEDDRRFVRTLFDAIEGYGAD